MGGIFSCFRAVPCADGEENVNRRNGSRNGCCGCFHIMIHALVNKRELRIRSKESDNESSSNDLSLKGKCEVESVHCSVEEEEDECPICLEEFTLENPVISTQCSHSYHLGCIYEWEKRSSKCPICSNVMVFEEIV